MKTELIVDLAQNKSITVVSEDDVEDVLEHNKQLRTLAQPSDWGRHVATIPCIVLVQWLNEEWQRGNKYMKPFSREWGVLVERKLRDPEWAYLRTDSSDKRYISVSGHDSAAQLDAG